MRAQIVVMFLAVAVGVACKRVEHTRAASDADATTAVLRAAFDVEISETLRRNVEAWAGTPHSSVDRRGLDCSAFVQRVYRDAFAFALPRSSRQQAEVGETVRPEALRPGDLVFFTKGRGRGAINHVGFYVGDGTFGHVSTSRGVMLSRLEEPYWRDRYHTARRVALGRPELEPAAVEPASAERPVDRRRHRGW